MKNLISELCAHVCELQKTQDDMALYRKLLKEELDTLIKKHEIKIRNHDSVCKLLDDAIKFSDRMSAENTELKEELITKDDIIKRLNANEV